MWQILVVPIRGIRCLPLARLPQGEPAVQLLHLLENQESLLDPQVLGGEEHQLLGREWVGRMSEVCHLCWQGVSQLGKGGLLRGNKMQ